MKDILLISPNAEGLNDKLAYPPLGLMYLAGNMDDEWNPTIKIMEEDSLGADEINKYEYFGISVHSVAVVKKAISLITEILYLRHYGRPEKCGPINEKGYPICTEVEGPNPHYNKTVIYVGGSAANLVLDNFDLPCIRRIEGEGENTFGHVDFNNLDTIKFPARHLLPKEMIAYKGKVHHTDKISTTMIATRGCVYNCSFCDRTTSGRRFRKRSVSNVCKEIELLIKDYGIQHIRFVDDCITLQKKWFIELCRAMAKYNITWTCMSRGDIIDDELLEEMKSAGCTEIFFGFESGSQRILDLMNKRNTVINNINAIDLCRRHGIKSCAYMMFGFPGENEESVNETIKFLSACQPDKARLSEFVPIPHTNVWLNPDSYNVTLKKKKDFWYYDNDELSMVYKYISDKDMLGLRKTMRDYFNKNFYDGWTK